jgi:hypothetical protein
MSKSLEIKLAAEGHVAVNFMLNARKYITI